MSHARVLSRTSAGIDAPLVSVEVHISNGLPSFAVVGLPESTVKEAKERVRSALLNSHLAWPDRRITVSLSPAELPKSGARFDLPIALAILAASGQLPADALHEVECYGELGLDGDVRPCRGLLSAILAGCDKQRRILVPTCQLQDLIVVPESQVIGVKDLLSTCAVIKDPTLSDQPGISSYRSNPEATSPKKHSSSSAVPGEIFERVVGQLLAKRAIEISAAGGHHLLMVGPPGAGKTLLANCLPNLLPPLTDAERIEVAVIRDLLGLPSVPARPFRAPHHSASAAGLIGGGNQALPGEISLAHHGVLFLDEIPEFPKRVLELLRQPLESGTINITRARGAYTYPADFQLVAAMNPCPCGFSEDPEHPCICTPDAIRRYQSRLSGPVIDRIDIHIQLERIRSGSLLSPETASKSAFTSSATPGVLRQLQRDRQGVLNAQLQGEDLLSACGLTQKTKAWLEGVAEQFRLSARALHKAMRVGRTLADMRGGEGVCEDDLLEALGYRLRQKTAA